MPTTLGLETEDGMGCADMERLGVGASFQQSWEMPEMPPAGGGKAKGRVREVEREEGVGRFGFVKGAAGRVRGGSVGNPWKK